MYCCPPSDALLGAPFPAAASSLVVGGASQQQQHAQPQKSDAGLVAGQVVANKWKLVNRIGRGAFGDIFVAKCTDEHDACFGMRVALKMEKLPVCPSAESHPHLTAAQLQAAQQQYANRTVLKLEAVILSKMQRYSYVGRFYEYGRDLDLNVAYLSMSLLGDNLLRLRRKRTHGTFTLPTVLRFGIQAIRAIQAVHEVGFLHRDIKPSNFVIAPLTPCGSVSPHSTCSDDNTASSSHASIAAHQLHTNQIYIIDFGLARAYRDRTTGACLPARSHVKGFRGTPRYASVHVHREEDLSRRDDLWSLLYILVEFCTGDLPWGNKREKEEIGAVKEKYMSLKLLKGCPSCFAPFMKHIHGLHFLSKPNYDYLCELLQGKLDRMGVSPNTPYDWDDVSILTTADSLSLPGAGALRTDLRTADINQQHTLAHANMEHNNTHIAIQNHQLFKQGERESHFDQQHVEQPIESAPFSSSPKASISPTAASVAISIPAPIEPASAPTPNAHISSPSQHNRYLSVPEIQVTSSLPDVSHTSQTTTSSPHDDAQTKQIDVASSSPAHQPSLRLHPSSASYSNSSNPSSLPIRSPLPDTVTLTPKKQKHKAPSHAHSASQPQLSTHSLSHSNTHQPISNQNEAIINPSTESEPAPITPAHTSPSSSSHLLELLRPPHIIIPAAPSVSFTSNVQSSPVDPVVEDAQADMTKERTVDIDSDTIDTNRLVEPLSASTAYPLVSPLTVSPFFTPSPSPSPQPTPQPSLPSPLLNALTSSLSLHARHPLHIVEEVEEQLSASEHQPNASQSSIHQPVSASKVDTLPSPSAVAHPAPAPVSTHDSLDYSHDFNHGRTFHPDGVPLHSLNDAFFESQLHAHPEGSATHTEHVDTFNWNMEGMEQLNHSQVSHLDDDHDDEHRIHSSPHSTPTSRRALIAQKARHETPVVSSPYAEAVIKPHPLSPIRLQSDHMFHEEEEEKSSSETDSVSSTSTSTSTSSSSSSSSHSAAFHPSASSQSHSFASSIPTVVPMPSLPSQAPTIRSLIAIGIASLDGSAVPEWSKFAIQHTHAAHSPMHHAHADMPVLHDTSQSSNLVPLKVSTPLSMPAPPRQPPPSYSHVSRSFGRFSRINASPNKQQSHDSHHSH